LVAKQPVLIMIQGPEPGSFYKLPDNRVTTVGRSSRNTLRAVSPSVSRFHCEIACVNGTWELNDLNSRKGTIVNGERIEGRCMLKPADIIRVGATVFRFDTVDETALQDGAMVAIMEAELDQKLVPKGEAAGSLDDIRFRSRLEGEQVRQERQSERRTLKANVAFVGSVAIAIGMIVTAVLAYAHRRAAQPQVEAERMERRARALYGEAQASLKSGDNATALEKLSAIGRDLPDTKTARDATRLRADVLWSIAQQRLSVVEEREADGDYAAALAAYDELKRLDPDKALEGLLAERRDYTVRLAHASFKTIDQAAQQRVAAGDTQGALELYRRAQGRIGVPELAAQAQAKTAELEKRRATQ